MAEIFSTILEDILIYAVGMFDFVINSNFYFVMPFIIAVVCFAIFKILKLIFRQVYK